MPVQPLLSSLARRLEVDVARLEPLPTTGLAHDHVRLSGSGRLLRVPKQSQLGLSAAANLAYQAACFKRAAPGG
ncbi:MAG: aminoglycoside phosphotransferase family protein, partial [Candidatus Competibacteraceae bacterium]|nr:aminoglycoside phosphotransferase family protein [Candidatus Competibacteraceae bacterium]